MLSIGHNSKLGKKVAVFNLPSQKTCPGATPFCLKHCYCHKAERMYQSALKFREQNLVQSKLSSFVVSILQELKRAKTKIARVHESGDFYSQEYLNKWVDIWTATPDIKWLAFTKSFDLDFSKVPLNVSIYFSIDDTTNNLDNADLERAHRPPFAKTLSPGMNQDYTYYLCEPITKTHRNYCGLTCTHCWDKRTNVAFRLH